MPRCFDLKKRKRVRSISLTEETWNYLFDRGKGYTWGIEVLVEEDKKLKGNKSPQVIDDKKI